MAQRFYFIKYSNMKKQCKKHKNKPQKCKIYINIKMKFIRNGKNYHQLNIFVDGK